MSRADASLRWAVPALLLLFAAFHLSDFVGEGLPLLVDAHSHLARSWFVSRFLGDGHYPAWSNAWYGGYRLLATYSPGYYWLTGLAAHWSGDPVLSTKAFVFGGQLAAAALLYVFTRRVGARPLFAGLAALLWVTSEHRSIVLGTNANYPSLFVYVALPLLLSLAAGYRPGVGAARRLGAAQALGLSAMALGHLANALLVLPAFLAFQAHTLLQRASGRALRRGAAAVLVSLLLLPALLAFDLRPMWAELPRVSLSLDAEDPLDPAGPGGLAILAGLSSPEWVSFPFLRSHGPLWAGLALAGALLAFRREGRRWRPLASGLAVSLASVALLDERASLGIAFFLYPLAVGALQELSDRLACYGRGFAALPGAAALGLAVAGALLGDLPTARYSRADALDVYVRIPPTPTPSRTFDVTPSGLSMDGFYGASSFSPYWSGRGIPFGGFPQGAPLGANARMALLSRLVPDLQGPDPALSEASLDALYLEHVQFLVDRSERPALARVPVPSEKERRPEEGLLALRRASPALYAPTLAPHGDALTVLRNEWIRRPLARDSAPSIAALRRTGRRRDWAPLLPLLRRMEIDRSEARAARILSDHALPPAAPSGASGGAFRVLEHRERASRVELVARSSRAGFVRLSYSHHPDLEVRLDGASVEAVPDVFGALVLAFPAGTHRIVLEAPTSPSALLFLDGGLAGLLLGVLALPGRSMRARSAGFLGPASGDRRAGPESRRAGVEPRRPPRTPPGDRRGIRRGA